MLVSESIHQFKRDIDPKQSLSLGIRGITSTLDGLCKYIRDNFDEVYSSSPDKRRDDLIRIWSIHPDKLGPQLQEDIKEFINDNTIWTVDQMGPIKPWVAGTGDERNTGDYIKVYMY